MGDLDQQLHDLEHLEGLAKPLLPLAGMGGAAVDAVTFVFGMVLRLIRIGGQVKAELKKAGDDLEQEIRTRSLFRVPVSVDTTTLEIRNFIELGRWRYPRAIEQLQGDIQRLDHRFDPGRRDARERLAIAMSVIPEVYERFEHTGRIEIAHDPLLTDDALRLMGVDDGTMYAGLVDNLWRERRSVLEADTTSLAGIRDRIPNYVRFRVGLEEDRLDAEHAQALRDLQSKLRDIYWTALVGSAKEDDPGLLGSTFAFIKDRSTKAIDEETASLDDEKATITGQSEDQRPPGRLDEIEARLAELARLRARVEELGG